MAGFQYQLPRDSLAYASLERYWKKSHFEDFLCFYRQNPLSSCTVQLLCTTAKAIFSSALQKSELTLMKTTRLMYKQWNSEYLLANLVNKALSTSTHLQMKHFSKMVFRILLLSRNKWSLKNCTLGDKPNNFLSPLPVFSVYYTKLQVIIIL